MRRSNKDILIGYINTLSDEACREAYYILQDKELPLVDWIEFDRVKLTRNQYSKLVWMWGEDKTNKCIELLNDWIIKKNITKSISCYLNIIGWVERAYYRLYPADDKSLRFDSSIDTATKAKRYVETIPKEMRAYDREVKFLVEKFGTKILP